MAWHQKLQEIKERTGTGLVGSVSPLKHSTSKKKKEKKNDGGQIKIRPLRRRRHQPPCTSHFSGIGTYGT